MEREGDGDPMWQNGPVDEEDGCSALSDYSSCEESEFERYCSANSVLGTSSVCSSVGNHSDFLDAFSSLASRDEASSCSGRSFSKAGEYSNSGIFSGGLSNWVAAQNHDGPGKIPRRRWRPSSCKTNCSDPPDLGFDAQELGYRSSSVKAKACRSNGECSLADINTDGENRVNDACCKTEPSLVRSRHKDDFTEHYGECSESVLPCVSKYDEKTLMYSDLGDIHLDSTSLVHPIPQRESQEHYMKSTTSSTCQDPVSGPLFYKISPVCSPLEIKIKGASSEKNQICTEFTDQAVASGSDKNIKDHTSEKKTHLICIDDIPSCRDGTHEKMLHDESNLSPVPLLDIVDSGCSPAKALDDNEIWLTEQNKSDDRRKISGKNATPYPAVKLDPDELFDDILLHCMEPHIAGLRLGNHGSNHSFHLKNGRFTSPLPPMNCVYPLIQFPSKIDSVMVVGSYRKKGDVSFGDRLIGVKEYVVYKLQVLAGKNQWEVERRYREFFLLYRQLKALFASYDLPLPSPWCKVLYESRKIFGNISPNVINERSLLIQDCLVSILNCRTPFGTPSSLAWFLSPTKDICDSSLLDVIVPQSLQSLRDIVKVNSSNCFEMCTQDASSLGKTISFAFEIKYKKSLRQLLEEQHYTCAGCHRNLRDTKSLMQELAHTLGWRKARICEYTCQLFCSSCHKGGTSILPSRVLHHWDFSLYPVCEMAKKYIKSIYKQPLLCVDAVNPSICSKVPGLLNLMDIRKKTRHILFYVRCPFLKTIERGLGCCAYLLEDNGLFTIRDMVDLSRGAFAALPVIVETVYSKVLDHVTHQCLACYDNGIPCAARHSCQATSNIIFPYQEAEVFRCISCGFLLHEICFEHLGGCPCGEFPMVYKNEPHTVKWRQGEDIELDGVVDTQIHKPDLKPSTGFISDLLCKTREAMTRNLNAS